MKRVSKLIFIIIISFASCSFATSAWCDGSKRLKEKNQRALLYKIASCIKKIKSNNTFGTIRLTSSSISSLRGVKLYKKIMSLKDSEISVSMINVLIRRLPSVAARLMRLTEFHGIANEYTYSSYIEVVRKNIDLFQDAYGEVSRVFYEAEHVRLVNNAVFNSYLDFLVETNRMDEAEHIFLKRYPGYPSHSNQLRNNGVIDYHGLSFGAAYIATHILLANDKLKKGFSTYRIIIGKGSHSSNGVSEVRRAIKLLVERSNRTVRLANEGYNEGIVILRVANGRHYNHNSVFDASNSESNQNQNVVTSSDSNNFELYLRGGGARNPVVDQDFIIEELHDLDNDDGDNDNVQFNSLMSSSMPNSIRVTHFGINNDAIFSLGLGITDGVPVNATDSEYVLIDDGSVPVNATDSDDETEDGSNDAENYPTITYNRYILDLDLGFGCGIMGSCNIM